MDCSASRLLDFLHAARAFLEPIWVEWHSEWGEVPEITSQWTCMRSGLFLSKAIEQEMNLDSKCVCGVPNQDTPNVGFHDGQNWQSHGWVEVENKWVVDVTADQFGAPPIILTETSDPRYRPGSGDTALPVFVEKRIQAVERILPRSLDEPTANIGECLIDHPVIFGPLPPHEFK